MQSWRAQLGWDGVSEESWDELRSGLFAPKDAAINRATPSSSIAAHVATAPKRPGQPSNFQRASSALPALPPKMKSSTLSNEYRVLKSGLQQAEARASVILQELENSLADSDHMITFDPRWLTHFTESHFEDTGPDQFELSIQKANKMLDFLNQKQREQEACEAMMQQLLDAFNSAEIRNVQDFGQVVRPTTIADSTGDWGGLQKDLELQVHSFRSRVFSSAITIGMHCDLFSYFLHFAWGHCGHTRLQLLMNRRTEVFQAKPSGGAAATADLNAIIQELESAHVQEIAKFAHDMNVQHAKASEAHRRELEAKDERIENVVATLGKVLKEREYLKNELQRAGHQNVIAKMKHAAVNERDMLKSIKDQITGKPSAAVQDRSMQTMDVQFADERDSDSDNAAPSVTASGCKSLQATTANLPLELNGVISHGELASAFKNIYETDQQSSKRKKKAKTGQDWSFIDLDAFAKEATQRGTTFDAIVRDIKLPKEWQKSLRVPPKSVMSKTFMSSSSCPLLAFFNERFHIAERRQPRQNSHSAGAA